MNQKKDSSKPKASRPISLAPLSFEDAVRAAMATGKPPKAKKRDVFVYFDNDVKVKSPSDAMSLAHRLGESAKGEARRGEEPPAAPKVSKKVLAGRVGSHWNGTAKDEKRSNKK